MPVTIRDVARQARVSVSTVSRALSAPGLVRETTRRRVLDVADAMGYQPNRAARSLITGRTGNLGIVVPDLQNPFYPGVLSGVQARAREVGCSVFFSDSGEDPAAEETLVRGMAGQVDGLILCAPFASDDHLAQLASVRPTVLLNRVLPGVGSVLMDSSAGMAEAVAHLAGLGHRECAYLSGPAGAWSNRRRLRGLLPAAREHGVAVRHLGPFDPNFPGGVRAADQALACGATAVVAFNDLMALGVLSRLADLGVAVPEQVSVVGFDDILYAAMCAPPLTTVALPMEAGGRAAVDLLLERLGGAEPSTRTLPTALRVRASTAPAG